ncbi:hypothetical protein [Enterococcus sp. DIV0212c]|nr:hypothetical protein [Enterococcus sp. DIV0212c]
MLIVPLLVYLKKKIDEYLGCLEVTQVITDIQTIGGQYSLFNKWALYI